LGEREKKVIYRRLSVSPAAGWCITVSVQDDRLRVKGVVTTDLFIANIFYDCHRILLQIK